MFNLRFLRDESRAISGRPRPVSLPCGPGGAQLLDFDPRPFPNRMRSLSTIWGRSFDAT